MEDIETRKEMRQPSGQPQRFHLMGRLPAVSARWGNALSLILPLLVASCDDAHSKRPPVVERNEAVLAPKAKLSAPSSQPSVKPPTTTAPKHRTLCKHLSKGRPFPSLRVGHAEARGAASLGDRIPVGGSWTWINLWAAWCGPCKEEIPRLLHWQSKLRDKMTVQFVSLDDDQRQLVRYLERNGKLRTSFWLPEGKVQSKWLESAGLPDPPELPVQLLVDPEGNIRCVVQGAITESDFARVKQIVSGR